jgi:hypothetical protein
MDSAFFGALLTACSLFRLQLPFKCINFFEKESQILLSESGFFSDIVTIDDDNNDKLLTILRRLRKSWIQSSNI